MNDVSNRAVREFSEFLNSIEADFFFFKQKTAYEISACLVGSEMCIRDSEIRYLDKLVDELTKGKPMHVILRNSEKKLISFRL